jgi:apolipoprotein N-acyltransferase
MSRRPNLAVNFALALLSAVLLVFTFPRFDVTLLAPFALAPLLIALAREPRPLWRFLLGHAAGVVYWFGVCYWIQGVLERYGGVGRWGGWGTFLLFCVLKAIHLGVFSMLAAIVMNTWYAIPVVAALWVGIERTHSDFGFAWLALGNAGIDLPLPLRMAPFLGVYGLSFLFAMLGTATALVLLRRGRKELLWLALVFGLFLFPEIPAPAQPDHKAVLVQPNVNQDQEWTPLSASQFHQRLVNLSLEAAVQWHPQIILWPETPGPIYYFRDPELRREVTDLARVTNAYLLFGTVGETSDGGYLNSGVLLRQDGDLVDRYDKINLVPFGEYVPSIFGFVNRITREAGDFTPGTRLVALPMGQHRLGTFICYESVFPTEVREFVKQGADLLVNISNDGYFGHTAAREQHLKIVRMRAVENRRWLLRATNDGITAVIDPAGRITERLPPYQEAVGKFGYSYVSEVTAYTTYGDWFAWGCLLLGLAVLPFTQLPHYTPRKKTKAD